ncbi:TIGR03899 family protein [Lacimicrobium alkaliphilum]|uniref:TIGR03899 family protein n=1 Tax=Lacimicrobium alkaliphilum TaxID=1526571 RepID=A0ABQ1RMB8_9ALTE|nr:TIGR03899 family protein [Lacimicrobium alkaliphilum]
MAPAAPRKTEPRETADTSQVRSRIIHWFAQAGLKPPAHTQLDESVEKKTQRHQKVLQQRKLQNLERILELAMEYSPNKDIGEEAIDPDWFFNYISMAEDIYSPAMQELWAKILAVEVSQPGTFSLRSISILTQLTHKDAKVFRTAVSLASRKRGDFSPRILFGYRIKPSLLSMLTLKRGQQLNLAQFGLAYPDLLSLMDLGLIYSTEIESGELDNHKRSEWRCCGESFHLSARRNGTVLNYYKFTATGAELFRLVSGKPHTTYLQALTSMLQGAFEVV